MSAAPLIRRLTPSDLLLFRKLNTMFGEAFGEPDTYGADPPGDAYVEDLLARDHVIALAAVSDEQVVGGLVAYELLKFERARSEVYIYDLAVAEAHRRRGIATALILHLRNLVRERGAWVVFIQADYGDEPAVALYEKLGVRQDVLHFDIEV